MISFFIFFKTEYPDLLLETIMLSNTLSSTFLYWIQTYSSAVLVSENMEIFK